MIIRAGVPIASAAFAHTLEVPLDSCPVLMSANAFWNADRGAFRVNHLFSDHDFALDSGGFVAMKRYGGYRWTAMEYALFAEEMRPTWWAAMDACCEPEIARDAAAVQGRIRQTVLGLIDCRRAAVHVHVSQVALMRLFPGSSNVIAVISVESTPRSRARARSLMRAPPCTPRPTPPIDDIDPTSHLRPVRPEPHGRPLHLGKPGRHPQHDVDQSR